MPKNYDQIIVDAVNRIVNYCEQKLVNNAGRYSVERYERIVSDINKMSKGAENPDYYLNWGWMSLGEQISYLDQNMWNKFISPFFSAAREYIKFKVRYGVIKNPDVQNLDVAISRLYARIGKDIKLLQVNPKQKPMDYKKTVKDTVEKIAEFYEAKLEKIENKISKEKYQGYVEGIANLREGGDIDNWDYFEKYGYMDSYDVLNLNGNVRGTVEKFFGVVREYVDAKNRKALLFGDEEKNLMRMVKIVRLRICGGMFESLKDMVLPNNYFMLRSDITR